MSQVETEDECHKECHPEKGNNVLESFWQNTILLTCGAG